MIFLGSLLKIYILLHVIKFKQIEQMQVYKLQIMELVLKLYFHIVHEKSIKE